MFTGALADAAAVNSLAQTLIKLTAPGVPDIYQGCELWDFSLVDPDNRRPVNFYLHRRLLTEGKSLSAKAIWERRADGLPKLWLIQKTLALRARHPNFFEPDYEPLFAGGAKVGACRRLFARRKIYRHHSAIFAEAESLTGRIALKLPPGNWRNEFTGEDFSGEIRAEKLFQIFPVALLARKEIQ